MCAADSLILILELWRTHCLFLYVCMCIENKVKLMFGYPLGMIYIVDKLGPKISSRMCECKKTCIPLM